VTESQILNRNINPPVELEGSFQNHLHLQNASLALLHPYDGSIIDGEDLEIPQFLQVMFLDDTYIVNG